MCKKCPEYEFPFPCLYQKVLPKASSIKCTAINPATYPNHTDCDYELEFIVGSLEIEEVFISSTSWRGRLVLRSGPLAYRRDGDRIFVLIGGLRFKLMGCNARDFWRCG